MSKKTLNIICENCDSEYTIKYSPENVSNSPAWCGFCGEPNADDHDDEDHDHDEILHDDEY